jgi:predicted enzyme related to lactoylglutathione lyase
MTDPFDDLREGLDAVDPDPAFARRLRGRLERALARPRGVVPMTATAPEPAAPRPAAVPYLAVADARAAIDWYVDVFAATVVGRPIEMPDGRIGHAELAVGDGVLYLADPSPDLGVVPPRPGEASVSLMLPVPDADGVRGRAIDRGASGERPPYDAYGQRTAWIVDPFGHRWGLHSPTVAPDGPFAPRPGDLAYASLWVPDVERARRFYAAVLGWTYGEHGLVEGTAVHTGFYTGEHPTLFCCWAVDDLEAARRRVVDAGGQAGEIAEEPFGRVVDCTDHEGTRFALWAAEPDPAGPPPPPNGRGPGDISYLTLQVGDSERTRGFYGSVLGWAFEPGRIEDGWAVRGPAPMTGLAGGSDRPVVVPQWIVADLARAVAAVRERGGSSTDPEQQPYGLTATCTDDQGTAFYLVQA